MDLVQGLQQSLHDLRQQLSELGGIDSSQSPDVAINTMIATMMNMLETMFVILNLPADGFVSLTPERPNATEPIEEASS